MGSKYHEKLMDLVFDHLSNLTPIVRFVKQNGNNQFLIAFPDGTTCTVTVSGC